MFACLDKRVFFKAPNTVRLWTGAFTTLTVEWRCEILLRWVSQVKVIGKWSWKAKPAGLPAMIPPRAHHRPMIASKDARCAAILFGQFTWGITYIMKCRQASRHSRNWWWWIRGKRYGSVREGRWLDPDGLWTAVCNASHCPLRENYEMQVASQLGRWEGCV